VLSDFIYELPLQTRQNLRYFQQDDASPHNARIVTHYLNEFIPTDGLEHIVQRYGTVSRPPLDLLDFFPLDFFLWDYLKDKVHLRLFVSVEDLKERIKLHCSNINYDQFNSIMKNVKKDISAYNPKAEHSNIFCRYLNKNVKYLMKY